MAVLVAQEEPVLQAARAAPAQLARARWERQPPEGAAARLPERVAQPQQEELAEREELAARHRQTARTRVAALKQRP
jgi:hypothetical protein